MAWRLTSFVAALAAAITVAPTSVRALDMTWVRGIGAESCADAGAMRERVSQHLGEDALAPGSGPFVEATVQQVDGVFIARLTALDGDRVVGRRVFESRTTCASVEEAVALAVSLIEEEVRAAEVAPGIETGAGEETEADPPGALAPTPPSEAPPATSDEPTPDSLPTPHVLDRLRVGVHLSLTFGLLPGLALGPELLAAVRLLDPVELYARAAYATGIESGPVQHALTRGAIGARVVLLEDVVDLAATAGLSVGALTSSVSGLAVRDTAPRAWGAVEAGADVGVRVDSIRLTLGLGLLVPFVTRRFVVEGRSDLNRETTPVSFHTSLGVEVEVP